ncbi:MAG: radical SAM family heme chaperone HemW [Gammaproteobacteria bacterium]|nr:radical SAM family heme chaperone HemW [Gammaproteobacteria bacterium]
MSDRAAADAALAGLYIHIPFCSAVCPYCDFSVQTANAKTKVDFVSALIREIALWREWSSPIDTVYFGGGTPSSLDIGQLSAICRAIDEHLPVTADAIWTLEVNPEDVTSESARSWQDIGFQCVSLGVQSFRDEELRQLGRRHSAAQARTAVRHCIDAPFSSVSVDLIFGLPNQTSEALRESLDSLIELDPQHVSCYQLTVHEGTTFGRWRDRGKLTEIGEDAQATLFSLTHELLGKAGFTPYEVSNFSRADQFQSKHNRKYWQHIPYLGLGPSAHSFDGHSRWWNHRTVDAYAKSVHTGTQPIASREVLDDSALALETLMLQLRTTAGLDTEAFQRRFNIDLMGDNGALIGTLIDDGLLRIDGNRLQPTIPGLAVADGIATRLAGTLPG